MALVLMQYYLKESDIVDDFKGFLVHNGIISFAGGIVIALTSLTFLTTFVKKLFLPCVYFFAFNWLKFVSPTSEKVMSYIYGHVEFDVIHFFQDLLVWVFMMFAVFLVLEFIVRRRILRDNKKFTSETPTFTSET